MHKLIQRVLISLSLRIFSEIIVTLSCFKYSFLKTHQIYQAHQYKSNWNLFLFFKKQVSLLISYAFLSNVCWLTTYNVFQVVCLCLVKFLIYQISSRVNPPWCIEPKIMGILLIKTKIKTNHLKNKKKL